MAVVFFTVEEVANMARVSVDYVYKLAARGELGCYKIGNLLRFTQAQVDEWLESKRLKSSAELKAQAATYVRSKPLKMNRKE